MDNFVAIVVVVLHFALPEAHMWRTYASVCVRIKQQECLVGVFCFIFLPNIISNRSST